MKKRVAGTMIVLEVMFIVAAYFVGRELPAIPSGWFYVLLGLAAFRGGRAIAFNSVFEWLRALMGAVVVPDSSGAGDNAECPPKRNGSKYALCQLVTCPICSGTWVAMALLVANAVSPEWGRGLIVVLAAAGVAEFLHWGSEFLAWGGRASREQAGTAEQDRGVDVFLGIQDE